MVVQVEYPCFASGEPRRLAAKTVGAVATALRQRLAGVVARPLDVDALMHRTKRLWVNGRVLNVAWDIDHPVHDDGGEAVLGVCEHDPAEPGTIMISLNGEVLQDQPELLRSTAVHELGHAVFDMPAALTAGSARAFRSGLKAPAKDAPIDWREWRADEFMGAFLAPKRQLARAFAREASAVGATIRWNVVDEIPTPCIAAKEVGGSEIDAIACALAEEFGVSESFMGVRFRKYRLVC
jgi:hypothetical protein